MRILNGILSSALGAAFGGLFGLFLAILLSAGNSFAGGFFVLIGVPLGLLLGIIGGLLAQKFLSPRKCGGLLGGSILLAGFQIWVISHDEDPPSDQSMITHFNRNQAVFEQLVEMHNQDPKLERVDENWTSPDHPTQIGVSPERLATYRALLRQAGVPRGFSTFRGEGQIEFLYWLRGSALSSDLTKGFVYTTTPPTPLLSSLDTLKRTQSGYRRLRGNWYLHYEFSPG